MTLFQAIVLGIVQGITEFLPISSSGHLIVIPALFGWSDQGLVFDVILHMATLIAVMFYFRRRIGNILSNAIKEKGFGVSRRMLVFLVLSIIPAAIVGLLIDDAVESLRVVNIVAYGLIGWGVVLYVADKFAKKVRKPTPFEKTSWKQALVVSLAQVIAFIPGTSRSGITMTAGLFSSMSRQAAAEFSFLMSIPVIAAAGFLKLNSVVRTGEVIGEVAVLAVGFIVALFSGIFAISFLMKAVKKWGFAPFAYYRVVLGIMLLLAF